MYLGPLTLCAFDLLFDLPLRVCKKHAIQKWTFICIFIKESQDNF